MIINVDLAVLFSLSGTINFSSILAPTQNLKTNCTLITRRIVEDKVMAGQSGKDGQGMIKAIAVLIRNTTWKCGRVERLVVNYLQQKIRRCGRARTPIREMLQHFKLSGKQKCEFLDAIKRLEKRRIIKVERF